MTGSSETSVYRDLTYEAVSELLQTIVGRRLRTKSEIRRVFGENALGFDEALGFCQELGLVPRGGGVLGLGGGVPTDSDDELRRFLVEAVAKRESPYRRELFEFLRKFHSADGRLVYRSPVARRSRESSCRNFLLSLGVLQYSVEADLYQVAEKYMGLHADAVASAKLVSPDSVNRDLQSKQKFGRAAEEVVLGLETERVGPQFVDQVVHTALSNAAAGFDIRSVTITRRHLATPRFIEVKAVQYESLAFHWTQNEIAVAKRLKDFYYLYLLPVVSSNDFDTNALRVIRDPVSAVLESNDRWIVSPTCLECRLSSGEYPS